MGVHGAHRADRRHRGGPQPLERGRRVGRQRKAPTRFLLEQRAYPVLEAHRHGAGGCQRRHGVQQVLHPQCLDRVPQEGRTALDELHGHAS